MVSMASGYTPELGERINERIAAGTPLNAVCEELGLAYSTVRRWIVNDEQFAREHAAARLAHAEHLFDEVITIADTPIYGVTTVTKPDGTVEERAGDMLGHRTLQINSRKWAVEKINPEKYGDKLSVVHSGTVNIAGLDREACLARLAELAERGVPVPQALLEAPHVVDAEFEDVHPGADLV